MAARILNCDQAIFTSTRVPTGEGYRIIASSRGLRPDAKQTITRYSPSQGALCWRPEAAADGPEPRYAVSFFALPGDLLCLAYTCYAGVEHTGRGGQRVYTLNTIFRRTDFQLCHYNPFALLRALIDAEKTTPLLTPPPVLPSLELTIDDSSAGRSNTSACPSLSPDWCAYLLGGLFDKRQFVVSLPDDWLLAAETLVIGLPGEARADVSFSTGLRYSVARSHDLTFQSDDRDAIKTRITGRPVALVEPCEKDAPQTEESPWLSFVHRHWTNGDLSLLARRTSLSFGDVSPEARERIGRLYNQIDNIRKTRTKSLLTATAAYLQSTDGDVQTGIAAELVVAAQNTLLSRLSVRPWDEVRTVWPTLCSIWHQSIEGRLFAQPLIERALDAAGKSHPIVAAHAALDLAQHATTIPGATGDNALIERVLTRLADWAQNAPAEELHKLTKVCCRWRTLRPQCPIIFELEERYGSLARI